jgi:MFS family permease
MGLSIGYTRVTTTLYAVQLHAHGWMLAVIAVAQSIGMLVLAAPAGRWVTRHGIRRVFLLASSWALLMCLLTPLVPAFAALVVFTALGSLAMPPRFVSINTVFMARLAELGEQRAGWFRAAHVIGMTFIGAVLATTLFPLHGAATAYIVAAGIFGLNILAFLVGIGRGPAPQRRSSGPAQPLLQLLRLPSARRAACWEFSIQALNAYFAFYIVIVILRDLKLPERVAGFAVASQGTAFVLTLVGAGTIAVRDPRTSRLVGSGVVMAALALLAHAQSGVTILAASATLGCGLGLLQILNLGAFARLGQSIGFSQAAAINALSGPSGGVFGGLLGGLLEQLVPPQTLFLAFVPVFAFLAWTHARPTERQDGAGTAAPPRWAHREQS